MMLTIMTIMMMNEVKFQVNLILAPTSCLQSQAHCIPSRTVYIDKSFIFNDEVFLNIESTTTTDQTLKKRNIQFSCDPKTTIDGYTLSCPRYGINDYFFEGN